MPAQIRLTKDQVADLKVLSEADLPEWNSVVVAVEGLPADPVLPDALEAVFKKAVPDAFAETLLRQSLSLLGMMLQLSLKPDQVFEALGTSLRLEPASWDEDRLARWVEREPLFRRILVAEAVVGTAKALDLSYEHAQLLRRARILTDIRPIFNQEGTLIRGAVISHTLRVRYTDMEGEHSLSIAIDKADIQSILNECQRALLKADATINYVEKTGLHLIVPGADV
jgi:hypothetical protein